MRPDAAFCCYYRLPPNPPGVRIWPETGVLPLVVGVGRSMTVLTDINQPTRSQNGQAAPRPQTIRSIYIDCTQVYQSTNASGIPRVVRNLVVQGTRMSRELGVDVRPVVLTARGFSRISADMLCQQAGSPRRADMEKRVNNFSKSAEEFCRSVLRKTGLIAPPPAALPEPVGGAEAAAQSPPQVGVAPSPLPRVHSLLRLTRKKSREMRESLSRWNLAIRKWAQHTEPKRGDLILLADSTWHVESLWKHVQRAKQRGALVASVMYDLIPVRRPDFVDDHLTEVFTRHLQYVIENTDFIIAISRDTSRDFLEYAGARNGDVAGGWSKERAGSFKLGGAEWTKSTASLESERCRDVVRLVGDRPAYLTVGTFEVRKNHKAILDAFDRLWQEGEDICLLILGRPGFRADAQIERVRNHPEFGKRLFWESGGSDADLESWYRLSRGVIMSSYAEGFGLPVAEAMARGKAAYASDIPAHREIGDGYCEFFEPGDAGALASLIRQDLRNGRGAGLKPLGEFRWPSWPDSVRECLTGCLRMASLGPRAAGRAPSR